MASSSSSTQDRSIASPKLYDVFISHRGPDVKATIAKQLYKLLQERECRAFLDREEIEGGDSIPSAIHNAICSSVVQIAIFSRRYAESSWCLDELALMLQQTDALFIPVFYDVQPWELRYIDNDKSQYAAAFSGYQRNGRNLDRLDKWKTSLKSASNISGYDLSEHQDDLCEMIVSRVLQEMEKRIAVPAAKYPVALDELVRDFENSCSETAGVVGIFGLAGSGKTTLAKELFNRKRSSYRASCCLLDVRESHANSLLHKLQSVRESHANSLLHKLQRQLLYDLFHEKRKFCNIDEGIGHLKHRLGRAKHLNFLIVLDDIDRQDQLDALLPEGMLSSGSLVIITTRDQTVLTHANVSSHYKMGLLKEDPAKELFCKHAFRGRDPPITYEKLIEVFVRFCDGLPLSLKVLGAHLYVRDEYYWILELVKATKVQREDIFGRLKISFDSLDREEKQIFIDIACFFNNKLVLGLDKYTSIWNASGWNAEHAVQTLLDKCLVEKVTGSRLDFLHEGFHMHSHIRDLGRQMADQLGPSRLWQPDLLESMEAKGFKRILTETKSRSFHRFWDSSVNAEFHYFIGGLNDSAEAKTDLLWLQISKNSGGLKCFPSWIPLRELYYLYVSFMEDLWSTFQQHLQNNKQASFKLRTLKLMNCPLQRLPDLIGMFSHLEKLEIKFSLVMTDTTAFVQSLMKLNNLRVLLLFFDNGALFTGNFYLSKGSDSTDLHSSTLSRMNSLESIQLFELHNIFNLVISGEICPRLRSLEVVRMDNLRMIDLQQLETLNSLKVEDCPALELLKVEGMGNLNEMDLGQLERLETLAVTDCPNLESITGLSSLTWLNWFVACNCAQLKLSTLAHLRHLEDISISKCHPQNAEHYEELLGLPTVERLATGPEFESAELIVRLKQLSR